MANKKMEDQLVSIIIPVFNEEANLLQLFQRLSIVSSTVACQFETIFVDNCSTDNSRSVILSSAQSEFSVRYIRLSRNFGPAVEASILAGLSVCRGDVAIILYSDLQDPPEMIPAMLEQWIAGFDVVHGVHTFRTGESIFRRSLVRSYYRFIRSLTSVDVPINSGDFKLLSRRVVNQIVSMQESERYNRGLVCWVGFSQATVNYVREERKHGTSSTSVGALFRTAITGVTSLSSKPLHLLFGSGLVISFLAALGIMSYGLLFVLGRTLPGVATVVMLLFLTFGLNIAALGLIGEYVARIYLESKRRPHFIIDQELSQY